MAAAATSTVNAQQAATSEVVSNFTISFEAGKAPSSLRQHSDGSFYGTTTSGGTFDAGVLFRMDATGAVTLLHHFSGAADGGAPSGLVRASDGRFYGVTRSGALTVFRFTPGGGLTTLHTFSSAEAAPVDLFAASDGNVYGLLERGGDLGGGSIFVIDSGGGVTTVHNIPRSAGISPSSFVKGSDGRFYITATTGGTLGSGTVFAIDDAGTITPLHNFGGASAGDGSIPTGLMQGRDGRLYGTTRRPGGDLAPPATVYAVDLAGNYELLHTFEENVQVPGSDLLEASDGNFYGVTTNSMFRLNSSGTLTMLQGLPSPGELIQGADGRLYAADGGRQHRWRRHNRRDGPGWDVDNPLRIHGWSRGRSGGTS